MSENATLGYLNPVSGDYRAFPEEINTLHDVREYLGVASKDPDEIGGMVPVGGTDPLTFSDLQQDPATVMLASAREKIDNDVRGFIRMPAPPLDIFILAQGEWSKHGSVDFGWTFATSTQAEYGNAFRSVVIPDQVLADPARYLDKAITFPARNPDSSLIPVILERIPEKGREHEPGAFACKDPCMALALCQEWGMFDGREISTPITGKRPQPESWFEVLASESVSIFQDGVADTPSERYVFRDGSAIICTGLGDTVQWGIGVHEECIQAFESAGYVFAFASEVGPDFIDKRIAFIEAGSPEEISDMPPIYRGLPGDTVKLNNRRHAGVILDALVSGEIGGLHQPPGTDRGITRTLEGHLAEPSPSLRGPGTGPVPEAAEFLSSLGFIDGRNGRNMSMSDIRQALQEHEGTVVVSNDDAFRWQFQDGSAVVATHDTIGLGVSRDCLDAAQESIDENFIPVSVNGSRTKAPDPLFVIPHANPLYGIEGVNVLSGMEHTGRVGTCERKPLVPSIPHIRLDPHLQMTRGAEIHRDADPGLER